MTDTARQPAVTPADIEAAAEVLHAYAVRTPLLSSPALDAMTGAHVYLKAEVLQRTGSFKFRGAFNRIASIAAAQRSAGVVAFSSGNHAQGVAAAAQIFGMPATIVMPSDAPASKIARTKGYGAQVVLYDRDTEDRDAIARGIAAERGAIVVPPYDDPMIVAGQGTVGREIAQDFVTMGISPDIVIAPASGGGLVAGVATAVKARFPEAAVWSAEPEGFDDHARSLSAGHRMPHRAEGRTICDALMASIPGELTFSINAQLLAGGVTATDEEVGRAVGVLFRDLKLVVEPGGAVALAALLAGKIDARGRNVVIVLSGGNVDAEMFLRLIGERVT